MEKKSQIQSCRYVLVGFDEKSDVLGEKLYLEGIRSGYTEVKLNYLLEMGSL